MREVVQICFAEAEVGDVVRPWRIARQIALPATVEKNPSGFNCLRYGDGEIEYPGLFEPLELLHRAYPEGKSMGDVQSDIDAAIKDTWLGRLSAEAGRATLKHLLMVHELSKPFDTAQGKPYKP